MEDLWEDDGDLTAVPCEQVEGNMGEAACKEEAAHQEEIQTGRSEHETVANTCPILYEHLAGQAEEQKC